MSEARLLVRALRAARRKIAIFIYVVGTLVVILGSLMYLIEGAENGFTSIPRGVYWAIVTLTTVGYGDISPQTAVGQALASFVMLLGYAIIAVPTGIVTAEIVSVGRTQSAGCRNCGNAGHDVDARFCKYCGDKL
jgi:voltage-gated potassium channel